MAGKSSSNEPTAWKLPLAILLCLVTLCGATVYILGKTKVVVPEEQRPNEQRAFQPPSPEQRQQFRKQIFEGLNLTEEQKQKIAALPEPSEGREGWQQRREAMQEILTPEQHEALRQNMRENFSARRGEWMNNMMEGLSPEDQKDLQDRFDRRREQRQQDGRRPWGDGDRPSRPDEPGSSR